VLAVRPERIRLLPESSDAEANAVAVTVTDVVYVGLALKYVLRTEAGSELIARRPISEGMALGLGAKAVATWGPLDGVVLGS
jgi:TOBE domain